MTEIEDLVRATLRERELDITTAPTFATAGASVGRPSSGWTGWRRRTVLVPAAVAAAVAAVAATLTLGGPASPPPPVAPVEPAALVGDVHAPPAGSQAVSSRGIEIFVPSNWLINDYFCGMSVAPTVMRGRSVGLGDCYTGEPPEKTVARIGPADVVWYPEPFPDGASTTPAPPIELDAVTIDGRPAERGLTRLADGRTAGLLRLVEDDVAVAVRALDPELVETVLDSAHLVDFDHAGCPVERPDALSYVTESDDDPMAVLDAVRSVTLCSYPVAGSVDGTPLLGSSIVLDGPAMTSLVSAIDQLGFGRAPDLSCLDPRPTPEEDVLIVLRLEDDSLRYVVVAAYGCDLAVFAATHPGVARVPPDLWVALAHTVWQGVTFQLADLGR